MTTTDASGRPSTARDECFGSLADAGRRAVVRIVHERSPSGVTIAALASRLASVTDDSQPAVVTEDEKQRARSACHHRHLPALSDAGLIEVDGETVRTTDHWAYRDPGIQAVLEERTTVSSDELDAVFEAIADPQRRRALSTLKHQYQPTTVDALAAEIVASETTEESRLPAATERVRTSLVHADLPLLADAGLVAYERASGHVSSDGHPLLRATWLGDTDSTECDSERSPKATSASRG
ncbi:hypothetical protein D8Y22_10460 [Salinadaptatus halalkaliphilus]|uniref:DUF7344 domain-containing protein n=1 Tax=Salinadaptatus halalkaliphilus TaxID=2419781 RepID=A0A4S3TLH6_9EURY|nr:hypothetical protein [Salinadaptatus halalkaliphilus]THE65019.1 hypothetical protein D8Y22_10460 [Salinadaptatus halalkaliphilus]